MLHHQDAPISSAAETFHEKPSAAPSLPSTDSAYLSSLLKIPGAGPSTDLFSLTHRAFSADYLAGYLPVDESIPMGATPYQTWDFAWQLRNKVKHPAPPMAVVHQELDAVFEGVKSALFVLIKEGNEKDQVYEYLRDNDEHKQFPSRMLEYFNCFEMETAPEEYKGSAADITKAPATIKILYAIVRIAVEHCKTIGEQLMKEVYKFRKESEGKKLLYFHYYPILATFANSWDHYFRSCVALNSYFRSLSDIVNLAQDKRNGPKSATAEKPDEFALWKVLADIFKTFCARNKVPEFCFGDCTSCIKSMQGLYMDAIKNLENLIVSNRISLQNVATLLGERDMPAISRFWNSLVDMDSVPEDILREDFMQSEISEVWHEFFSNVEYILHYEYSTATVLSLSQKLELMLVHVVCVERWLAPVVTTSIKQKVLRQTIRCVNEFMGSEEITKLRQQHEPEAFKANTNVDDYLARSFEAKAIPLIKQKTGDFDRLRFLLGVIAKHLSK